MWRRTFTVIPMSVRCAPKQPACQNGRLHIPAGRANVPIVPACSRTFRSGIASRKEAPIADVVAAEAGDAEAKDETPVKTGGSGKSLFEDDDEDDIIGHVGSASPWAHFDSWGVSEIHSFGEKSYLMDPEAVRIPLTDKRDPANKDLPSETEILDEYEVLLRHRSSVHLGYPYNLNYNNEELHKFMKYSINNLGDPFVASNYGVHSRQFEVAVVDFFASLWGADKDSYWGYVTSCGTEGNLHAILLARELHPDGVLYASNDSHYSIFKAAKYYRMDSEPIKSRSGGEIDYQHLERKILKNKDRPVIISLNIGTTVKGAVDDLDRVLRMLHSLGIPREKYYIHCDGALFASMIPFIDYAPTLSFQKPIDSIAVSGHKMLGCPMPCGITVTRKSHIKKVEEHIAYLNSVDTTIMGSRNGQAALYLWYTLRRKGLEGLKSEVLGSLENARYLRDTLGQHGIRCQLNDLSTTVVMEKPVCPHFIKKWQLACENDIAHVVVMPNITRDKIGVFVEEFVAMREENGAMEPMWPKSPLSRLHKWR